METTDIGPLLEDFEGNIDELEDILQPLLKGSLAEGTNRLPLLDKAKTYVLITYAIESILFCKLPAYLPQYHEFEDMLTLFKHICD